MMEGRRFKTEWKEEDMIAHHLGAVRAQLRQLRTALQLAVALNRTLIMPKVSGDCLRSAHALRMLSAGIGSWLGAWPARQEHGSPRLPPRLSPRDSSYRGATATGARWSSAR